MSWQRRGESNANVLATPWRYVPVVVLLAATLTWSGIQDALLTRSLQDQKRVEQAHGRFIAVITEHGSKAGDTGGIPGTSCDALGSLPGITAAGLFVSAGTAVLRSEPSGGMPLWNVSPGLARLFGAEAGPGVLVGSESATELGLRSGARLAFVDPTVPSSALVHVYPADGDRTATLDRAILVITPAQQLIGSCLVEIVGTSPNTAASYLGALLGTAVDVRPLIDPAQLGADPDYAFAHRAQRFVTPFAPTLAILVWILLLRARRNELALQRIFGLPRALLATTLMGEFGICLTVALIPALTAVAVAAQGDRIAAMAGASAVGQGCAVAVALAVPATFLLTIRRGAELSALRGAE